VNLGFLSVDVHASYSERTAVKFYTTNRAWICWSNSYGVESGAQAGFKTFVDSCNRRRARSADQFRTFGSDLT
jgi:hypothetical protein